jgi:hypothetical protein
MVFLRIVHIVTGVVWVGSSFVVLRRRRSVDVVSVDAVFTLAGSGGPLPETAAQIGALQHRLVIAQHASFALVLLAVVAMASARYL